MRRRIAPALASGALALLAVACFETPVREALEIRVLPAGRASVRATVDISETLRGEGAQRRAATARTELLREEDAWSRRFAGLDPEKESFRRIEEHGKPVTVERTATVRLGDLERLFADTGVSVLTTSDGTTDEIVLQPFASPRATRDQEAAAQRAMSRFVSALETYYRAVNELHRLLDANPHRAAVAFAALFEVDSDAGYAMRAPRSRSKSTAPEGPCSIAESWLDLYSLKLIRWAEALP